MFSKSRLPPCAFKLMKMSGVLFNRSSSAKPSEPAPHICRQCTRHSRRHYKKKSRAITCEFLKAYKTVDVYTWIMRERPTGRRSACRNSHSIYIYIYNISITEMKSSSSLTESELQIDLHRFVFSVFTDFAFVKNADTYLDVFCVSIYIRRWRIRTSGVLMLTYSQSCIQYRLFQENTTYHECITRVRV